MSQKDALEFRFKADGGVIPPDLLQAAKNVVARLVGKSVILSIRVSSRRRSNNQNAYYWGVVIPYIKQMFDDYGNNLDEEDIHEFLKKEIGKLSKSVLLPTGEFRYITGSSAELSTVGMENYLEKIRAWAAECGLVIPLPNERMYYYEERNATQNPGQ